MQLCIAHQILFVAFTTPGNTAVPDAAAHPAFAHDVSNNTLLAGLVLPGCPLVRVLMYLLVLKHVFSQHKALRSGKTAEGLQTLLEACRASVTTINCL